MNELKTWGDLAKHYNMVLFNKAPKLNDGEVLNEWYMNHNCDTKTSENGCECEVFQWYIIEINDADAEHLNEKYDLDVFYSECLDNYILPVYHFGTSWDILSLNGGYADETK